MPDKIVLASLWLYNENFSTVTLDRPDRQHGLIDLMHC